MRVLAAAVLGFEALVVALATPVAIQVAGVAPAVALPTFLGVALACLVTAGLLRRPWAYAVGWAVQVLVVGLGLVVPTMLALGGLFAFLWFMALRLGRQAERVQEQRRPGVD